MKVTWIQSCGDCSSHDFPLAVLFSSCKVQPKHHFPTWVTSLLPILLPEFLSYYPVTSSLIFILSYLFRAFFPLIRDFVLLLAVFQALSTNLIYIYWVDKSVELLKHLNKPICWPSSWSPRSFIFFILTNLLDFMPIRYLPLSAAVLIQIFLTFGPLHWPLKLSACLQSPSSPGHSVNPQKFFFFLSWRKSLYIYCGKFRLKILTHSSLLLISWHISF